MRLFCVGFPRERESGVFFFKIFSKSIFFRIFSYFSDFPHYFSIFSTLVFMFFFLFFRIFVFFFISGLIFARLFGGLSRLRFLRILYAHRSLDVQFSTILASFNLKLWPSRYCVRKEGDAKLKNFGRFFLKNSYLPI